jgi:hypothetical protein
LELLEGPLQILANQLCVMDVCQDELHRDLARFNLLALGAAQGHDINVAALPFSNPEAVHHIVPRREHVLNLLCVLFYPGAKGGGR